MVEEHEDKILTVRRAYRRLLCASEEPYRTYAIVVLADILDKCGAFHNNYDVRGGEGANGYLAGRESVAVEILYNLGITDMKKITEVLTTVLPTELNLQKEAERE